ncbi:ATP-binding protein [Streptomyces mirabilis]|uniref:ATP-binding protein n=1 Tax=Streptomyces mirabilis TaxID=68239 RepID=UPI0037B2CC36
MNRLCRRQGDRVEYAGVRRPAAEPGSVPAPESTAVHRPTSDPGCLKSVRRFVRETITAWGLAAFADDTTTVVNELTINAIRYALDKEGEPHGKAWLGIARTSGAVVCAVTDPNPAPPSPHAQADLAPTGRGLLIVDALTSSHWGYAEAAPAGKTVCAHIAAPRL